MIKRAERADIYENIVRVLKTGSFNILQISEKAKINWKTVENALKTLAAAGFIIKENSKYRLTFPAELNSNTILGLPIKKEQEKEICEIANKIKSLRPDYNRTFLQKAVIDVIKQEKLHLPFGWYLFGECTILKLDQDSLDKYPPAVKYKESIRKTILKFDNFKTTDELLKAKYTEENNELYKTRLSINKIFNKEFSTDSIRQLELEFKNIFWEFKKNDENTEIYEYIEGFFSTYALLAKLPLEELENLRLSIYEAFTLVWEMIGTYNLFMSVRKLYNEDISIFYKLRINILKEIEDFYLHNLQEYWPKIELHPDMEKLHKKYVKGSQDT